MKRFLLAASAALSLCACATVTRGTEEVYVVESTPPGAAVKLSTGMACDATPCSFKVPRKDSFTVTVSKAGYQDSTHTVQAQISGGGGTALAGNVLVGGLIGIGVDALTGAGMEHKPNPLQVTLAPTGSAVASEPGRSATFDPPASGTPAS